MSETKRRYQAIIKSCETAARAAGRKSDGIHLIAVSKTFDAQAIFPIIEAGHRVFGENRVQEANGKWPQLKQKFPDIELHLIGPLQSNKVADAVALFDVIETVDRDKIAKALAKEMAKQNCYRRLFVQVNTGGESQKAGIAPKETSKFLEHCRHEYGLEIEGLMCIPPFGENPGPHFALLRKLALENNVKNLSMGMSSDFEIAIELGATHVRVGSAIFGQR